MSESEPSTVARFVVRTDDPQVAHDTLREAYTDFTVTGSGATAGFTFSHDAVAAPDVMVGRMHYGASVEMAVRASRSSLLVPTRWGGRLAVESGRSTATPDVGEPLLMPTEASWDVRMADVTAETVVLDRSTVQRVAASVFGSDDAQLRFDSMTPVSPTLGRYWQRVVRHVRHDVLGDDRIARLPLVVAEATRSLAAALLVVFPSPGLVALEQAGRHGHADPAVLRRAVEYIDEHAGEPVGVEDVAAAARIGVRGLQRVFRTHRDCTPLEHLRRVRMQRAHLDLQVADPTRGDTVVTVAARWGFTHAGRFSVEYRRQFGRSPSRTLRE